MKLRSSPAGALPDAAGVSTGPKGVGALLVDKESVMPGFLSRLADGGGGRAGPELRRADSGGGANGFCAGGSCKPHPQQHQWLHCRSLCRNCPYAIGCHTQPGCLRLQMSAADRKEEGVSLHSESQIGKL